MNGRVPHIVQYQGSKRNLAPKILPYFPKRFNRLIEPFAGMAAITIAVSIQNKAQSYHLNDLNKPLVSVLEETINHPQRLTTPKYGPNSLLLKEEALRITIRYAIRLTLVIKALPICCTF